MSERERRGRWKDTLSRSSSPSWRRTGFHVGWVGWLVTPNHPDDASTDGGAGRDAITPATDIPRMGPSVHPLQSIQSERQGRRRRLFNKTSVTRWTWQPPLPEMLRGTILWRRCPCWTWSSSDRAVVCFCHLHSDAAPAATTRGQGK